MLPTGKRLHLIFARLIENGRLSMPGEKKKHGEKKCAQAYDAKLAIHGILEDVVKFCAIPIPETKAKKLKNRSAPAQKISYLNSSK
jgi:hypothetical protein